MLQRSLPNVIFVNSFSLTLTYKAHDCHHVQICLLWQLLICFQPLMLGLGDIADFFGLTTQFPVNFEAGYLFCRGGVVLGIVFDILIAGFRLPPDLDGRRC